MKRSIPIACQCAGGINKLFVCVQIKQAVHNMWQQKQQWALEMLVGVFFKFGQRKSSFFPSIHDKLSLSAVL